jgi:hypothetical protein
MHSIMITPVRGILGSAETRVRKTRADMIMPEPPLDPPVADQAPTAGDLTGYDHEQLVTYLRLLDADAEGADWAEVA